MKGRSFQRWWIIFSSLWRSQHSITSISQIEPSQTSVNLWGNRNGSSMTVSCQVRPDHQSQPPTTRNTSREITSSIFFDSQESTEPLHGAILLFQCNLLMLLFLKPAQVWKTSDRIEVFSSHIQTWNSPRLIRTSSAIIAVAPPAMLRRRQCAPLNIAAASCEECFQQPSDRTSAISVSGP